MDVDARFAVGHFRDDARNERYAENVEFMGDSMAGEGFDDRVATDDFSVALCGRIAQIGGFYVGCQRAAHLWQTGHKFGGYGFGFGLTVGVVWDAFFLSGEAESCLHL